MSKRLADYLDVARRRYFVGREQERALFQEVLSSDTLPFFVLHLFGPGGVGKSTLLKEFLAMAQQAGVPAFYLDAHNLDHTPAAFLTALQTLMGVPTASEVIPTLAALGPRQLLLLDTYEQVGPLDDWLREHFLPELPESVFVVIAGRYPPSLAWRTAPAWQPHLRTRMLRNLGPDESRAFLSQRQVPLAQQQTVLDVTYGHPLALSLVADVLDQRAAATLHLDAMPDVIQVLLDRFVEKVPTPLHRIALESCALTRLTTEPLLAVALEQEEVYEIFEWLRGLSFVTVGKGGLFPHDLVRDVLSANLRWRNPDRYLALHQRIRRYYARRLEQTSGREQRRVLLDYNYLHRDSPTWKPFFEWEVGEGVWTTPLDPADVPALVAMVAEHEGAASARYAEQWLQRAPESALIFRDAGPLPAGFMLMLALEALPADWRASDPVTKQVWHYLTQHAPLRAGEKATLFRFWMARDRYQAVSATQTRVFLNAAQHYLTTPGLALSFFPVADPDFWLPAFAYMDLHPLPELAFEVGGRRVGVFSHDWRVRPPIAWLELLAEREVGLKQSASPEPARTVEPLFLDETGFAAAIRDALRDYRHPDLLRHNPLTRSRLILEQAGVESSARERTDVLRARLREAIESLQGSARDLKLYRALYHTYLLATPSQERAAELLDVPFSTFRRHLKQGVERVTRLLWQREVGRDHPLSG